MSIWPGTQRYGIQPAPGGLALVQELVNTRPITRHGTDLLADGDVATDWADRAVPTWMALRGIDGPHPKLTDVDARALREMRGVVAGFLAGTPDAAVKNVAEAARLAISREGKVQVVPSGRGWRWLSSALWAEVMQAQVTGVWSRLKTCRNPDCGTCFYDRSKNNSGVWHDVRTCGNVANLRASRARRRAAQT